MNPNAVLNLTAPRYAAGNRANPGGKPVGTRNRITARFLNDLAEDFEKHGKSTISAARREDPVGYLKVIAALLPKQIEAAQPLGELSDHELLAMVEFLRAQLSQLSPEQLLALRAQMPGSGQGAVQMPVANGDEPA